MTYENSVTDYEDFPQTEDPVFILGRQYSTIYDLDDIKLDILSRLWFTYRKGFSAIGGTGPTGDAGWGCMLRCGQMMMSQALLLRHVGREWRWSPDRYDPKYHEILRMFADKKQNYYSIHQIASMGVSEGKAVGEWFGPNTVAQVLRKLSIYDEWSNVTVHVALDNTVIKEDIRRICKIPLKPLDKERVSSRRQRKTSSSKDQSTKDSPPSVASGKENIGDDVTKTTNSEDMASGTSEAGQNHRWKPLVLIIPLRLGLSEINPVYERALKMCLTLKQSIGIIGGKPNHAHYFIGYIGDELVYLDPHTVQNVVDFTSSGETDETYHCPYGSRMKISSLDPSIAVGFYCGTEEEFDDWCLSIHKFIVKGERTPMFELHEKRPRHWPAFEPYSPGVSNTSEFDVVENRNYDTDEEFELL